MSLERGSGEPLVVEERAEQGGQQMRWRGAPRAVPPQSTPNGDRTVRISFVRTWEIGEVSSTQETRARLLSVAGVSWRWILASHPSCCWSLRWCPHSQGGPPIPEGADCCPSACTRGGLWEGCTQGCALPTWNHLVVEKWPLQGLLEHTELHELLIRGSRSREASPWEEELGRHSGVSALKSSCISWGIASAQERPGKAHTFIL